MGKYSLEAELGGDCNGALDESVEAVRCCCCCGADEYGDRGTRADWDDDDDDGGGLDCAELVVEASQSDSLTGGYAASAIGSG